MESTSDKATYTAPTQADIDEAIKKYGRDIYNDFDLDDPAFNEKHFEIIDDLVEKCPVAHSKVGDGYYIVAQNSLVKEVGQNWRTFSAASGYMPNRPEGVPFLYPEESDPPLHTAWRQSLNPFMGPGVVNDYEDQIRADANTLIDRFIDNGKCEFVSEFAAVLPGWAFFKNVLGVPVEDLDKLVDGVEQGTFSPDLEERGAKFGFVFEYLGEYLKKRSEEPPRGDMVDMIAAGVEYEDGTMSPWEDRVSVLVDMTFGGIATTTYVMASAINWLAENPKARQLLIDDPETYVPRAIEEFARVFAPVVALGRTCTKDVEIGGRMLSEGDFILMMYAGASRDPAVVEDPKTIDISRESVLHSAFGVGIHRCIGSNLARLELRATFEEWLKRVPEWRVVEEPVYMTGQLRSIRSLNLAW
ncbi:cytochrome P450 [Nocardioides panzhihuensis]|uniref:Cytochrome P450 n=1 Tax=Nocardioides panzhihuensis TaxID=860243 RepID=A0A7Z0DID3_9ACTN|nr:cytochrome P450 [Nocardioides panzhihuensis]NYI75868.1 cytochrome P450 [Nocardioides panzhihuensis]